jgi:integrase/recombinase XerC/integrase/recombinase XerD
MLWLCPPNTWWGARDRAILLSLLLTGIRLEELSKLTLHSINLSDRYIRVRGKGNEERKIYLEQCLAKALIGWLMMRPQSKEDALWLTKEGERLSMGAIKAILYRLGKRAGTTDVRVSAHTFRHTFATNMLRAGKDVRYLQAVLGHETLKSTEIYVCTLNQEDAIKWHKNAAPFREWKL